MKQRRIEPFCKGSSGGFHALRFKRACGMAFAPLNKKMEDHSSSSFDWSEATLKRKVLLLGGPWEKKTRLKSMLMRLKYAVLEPGRTIGSEGADLILLDMRGEEPPCWERLKSLKQERGETPVIVVGEKKIDSIVTAMKLGASNYMSEPFDAQDLKSVLMNILDEHHLVSEIAAMNEIAKEQPSWLLSSCSPAMNEVKKIVEQVAGTDVTVLIRGESGTGKGVVARAIYLRSRRREMPFVKINCAALPKELLESELFGYEKGAFTGAYQRKAGKFGLAHEGTIFLDEISEMHASLQAKLLHVLETGEFSRLGGEENEKVNVRIVAATSSQLESAVRTGLFRDDLFYRLNVVAIRIPPLRERKEEIPLLAEYFLRQYHHEYNKAYRPLSPEILAAFIRYDWPGNVRELENFIKRVVILGEEHCSLPLLLSKGRFSAGRADPSGFSLKQVSRDVAKKLESEVIRKVLNQTRWNRRKAAEILKISYRSLLYKIKEGGLETSSS